MPRLISITSVGEKPIALPLLYQKVPLLVFEPVETNLSDPVCDAKTLARSPAASNVHVLGSAGVVACAFSRPATAKPKLKIKVARIVRVPTLQKL